MNVLQNAGLGAMMQTKGAGGAGASKQSMHEMMAMAQKLPDSELADVLAGKSMRVPQFAAMLAAMGRESLRTAVAGAQAGQAKEPSAKDRMLAKMAPQTQPPMPPQAPAGAGLEAIPAPNMEQMGQGMADGGIVAFSEGDVVEEDRRSPSEKAMDEYVQRIQNSSLFKTGAAPQAPAPIIDPSTVVKPDSSAFMQDAQRTLANRQLEIERQKLISKFGAKTGPVGYFTSSPQERKEAQTTIEFLRTATPQQLTEFARTNAMPSGAMGDTTDPAGAVAPTTQPGTPPPPPSGTRPPGSQPPGAGPSSQGIGALAVQPPQMPEARKSPIDSLMAPDEDVSKQIASSKNQAQGEFLMTLGARIMQTPNLGAALGKGVQEGLPGLAASRKEISALQKDQRDYRLNLAKAQEAAAQGKDDLAFKYADLAEKAQYHAGIIAVSAQRAAGGGGALTQKQYEAATKAADTALEKELSRLGPRARLMTPEQRDAFRADAFNRTLQAIQSGVMPQAPGIELFQAPPSGAVVRD
jgi:hypothetical protein